MNGGMGGDVVCMGGMGKVRRDNRRGGSLHEAEEVLPLCYRIYPFVHETSNLIAEDVDRSCTIRPNGFPGDYDDNNDYIDTGNTGDVGDNGNDGEDDSEDGGSDDGDSTGDGGDGDEGDDDHGGTSSSSHGTVTYHTSSLKDFLLHRAIPRAMPRETNGGVVDGSHGTFDAVVTCFFVDTAADLIDLVGSIHRCENNLLTSLNNPLTSLGSIHRFEKTREKEEEICTVWCVVYVVR